MTIASRSNEEDKVELPGWGPEDWVKPSSCLAEVCGLEDHICGGLDCVKTLERQHKQLTILFGNVVMKARTEKELIADCHGGTEVNLVTALGFYSMFGTLESLLNLEQKVFSVPMCVRLTRMSEKSYELLCKMLSAVPERTKEELESMLGRKFMGYVIGNFSDLERQKQRGSTVTDYNKVDENDEVHRVMMEVETLLEASGKRNWRSIMLTHDEFPCH